MTSLYFCCCRWLQVADKMRPNLATEAYSLFSLRVGLLLALLDSANAVSTSSSSFSSDSTIPPQQNQTDASGPYLAHQQQDKEPECESLSLFMYFCFSLGDLLISCISIVRGLEKQTHGASAHAHIVGLR